MNTLNSLTKKALQLHAKIAKIESDYRDAVKPLSDELADVLEQLEAPFVAEYGEKGATVTKYGKITRSVTNSYSFADNAKDKLLSVLSPADLAKYANEEVKYTLKPTARARAIASDGDAANTDLGHVMRNVLLVKSSAKFKLEPVS